VIAYKFLGEGAYGVLSGFAWPRDAWVEVEGELVPNLNGIHGCRPGQLPYWIDRELWRVELTGEVVESDRLVVARRGRLVDQVASWTPELADELAAACAARLTEPDWAADAEERLAAPDPVSEIAYYAAAAAGAAARAEGGSYEEAFASERAWQAAWLADRLAL
jgi:hypothetical protein